MSAAERRYLLRQVNSYAQADLRALWAHAESLLDVDFFAYVRDGFPAVADPYVALSGGLAANWFEESAPSVTAALAEPIPLERLMKSAEWALGATGAEGLDRLAGTLQRAVFDGARDTTLLNVKNTKSRWSRETSGDACDFCEMLAGRGAVYSSDTAGFESHDHCHCMAVEHIN